MGKARRNKSYRVHQPAAKKNVQEDPVSDNEESTSVEAQLSRGQRKRQKRRDAFLKKMGMVQRAVEEKEKESKKSKDGMFGDLEELQKSLFSTQVEAISTSKTENIKSVSQMTGKQKKRLAMQELGHLKAVQTHPAFQSNPFAAIQMHLQNTVVRDNKTIQ
ncbi:hypothetical protein THRCLA_00539 [Thraustotheca clavata]|uniref:Ribosome biogenesis protein SLX9 n=1 Tax=Thraustotheca clavata TaxID=74557 RepID=A0A1W0AB85_9STRA|nr:hypothetical protein THRCLA_00539 [Thraustotheca clavata]